MVSRSIREIGSSKPNWPFAGSNRREEGFGRVETYYRVRWQDFFDAHAEGISMTCPVLDEVQNSTRRTTSSACKWHMAVRQGQTCTTKPDSIKDFLARTYRKAGIGMAWLLCRGRKKERMGTAVAELGRIRFGSR